MWKLSVFFFYSFITVQTLNPLTRMMMSWLHLKILNDDNFFCGNTINQAFDILTNFYSHVFWITLFSDLNNNKKKKSVYSYFQSISFSDWFDFFFILFICSSFLSGLLIQFNSIRIFIVIKLQIYSCDKT